MITNLLRILIIFITVSTIPIEARDTQNENIYLYTNDSPTPYTENNYCIQSYAHNLGYSMKWWEGPKSPGLIFSATAAIALPMGLSGLTGTTGSQVFIVIGSMCSTSLLHLLFVGINYGAAKCSHSNDFINAFKLGFGESHTLWFPSN